MLINDHIRIQEVLLFPAMKPQEQEKHKRKDNKRNKKINHRRNKSRLLRLHTNKSLENRNKIKLIDKHIYVFVIVIINK